jgi:invasion protein IalB
VRQCDAKQEQVNQQSRQMVLAIELTPVEDKIEGVALFPFGLALDSGVSFQIDEQPTAPPIHFRTCLPTGCVVPLTFDARTVALLRNGTTLKAKVVADGGGEAVLSISLKGLAAAIDRRAALAPSERNLAQKQ